MEHEGHTLYWVSCKQVTTHNSKEGKSTEEDNNKEVNRFVFITNIKPTGANVREICQAGRNRWKIENQGYNSQKNGGYSLGLELIPDNDPYYSYAQYYKKFYGIPVYLPVLKDEWKDNPPIMGKPQFIIIEGNQP